MLLSYALNSVASKILTLSKHCSSLPSACSFNFSKNAFFRRLTSLEFSPFIPNSYFKDIYHDLYLWQWFWIHQNRQQDPFHEHMTEMNLIVYKNSSYRWNVLHTNYVSSEKLICCYFP